MVSTISKWGNSQGIRISKKMLLSAGMNLNDVVEVKSQNNSLIIRPAAKKNLDWYLEGCNVESDRFDWGTSNEPKGRELL